MAQLLIRAKDNTHPDPAVDERACYKRGDVVVVVEDDHQWGRLEGPPDFEVVSVPGPASQWAHLREEEPMPPTGRVSRTFLRNRARMLRMLRDPGSPLFHPDMRRRRKWKVNLDDPARPLARKTVGGM